MLVHCLFLCCVLVELSHQELDILSPYPDGFHMDSRRTHRHARSCMMNYNNTEMFSSIKTSNVQNDVKLHRFRIKNSNNQIVYGHRVVVKNPASLVSVLEPSDSGGCKSRTLSTVAKTARQGNCYIATNAGFFQPNAKKDKFGQCYGNLVSNGRYVQDSNGIQNANFGIRKDGTLVIGYLSEVDVLSTVNPFTQLVSGVGWVIKNGSLFVEGSKSIECLETQTTGDRFFNVHSARALIGFDGNGYVHLFQFDGKTDQGGVSLEEAGRYMKKLGVTNAINLDGGGSATFVIDGVVANYPSDGCGKDNSICARNVSSIICLTHTNPSEEERILDLSKCCNQNYVLVVGFAALLGLALLGNTYLLSLFMTYRERLNYVTSSTQQKEAMKSLLDHPSYSLTDESDEDEL